MARYAWPKKDLIEEKITDKRCSHKDIMGAKEADSKWKDSITVPVIIKVVLSYKALAFSLIFLVELKICNHFGTLFQIILFSPF